MTVIGSKLGHGSCTAGPSVLVPVVAWLCRTRMEIVEPPVVAASSPCPFRQHACYISLFNNEYFIIREVLEYHMQSFFVSASDSWGEIRNKKLESSNGGLGFLLMSVSPLLKIVTCKFIWPNAKLTRFQHAIAQAFTCIRKIGENMKSLCRKVIPRQLTVPPPERRNSIGQVMMVRMSMNRTSSSIRSRG